VGINNPLRNRHPQAETARFRSIKRFKDPPALLIAHSRPVIAQADPKCRAPVQSSVAQRRNHFNRIGARFDGVHDYFSNYLSHTSRIGLQKERGIRGIVGQSRIPAISLTN
jgi:hypothetical protein